MSLSTAGERAAGSFAQDLLCTSCRARLITDFPLSPDRSRSALPPCGGGLAWGVARTVAEDYLSNLGPPPQPGEADEDHRSLRCPTCDRRYPILSGIPDLRLSSDRYLGLEAERAKALALGQLAGGTDFSGLARAYYARTADVDARRRSRYLAHLARAEQRGAALARLLPRKGSILEVGCGTGGLLAAATRSGRRIAGVDIALRWLVLAGRRLEDCNLDVPLVAAPAERLPWEDGAFSAVVADSVLEHLDDPAAALREWRRVVAPGGTLLIWSPNRFSVATDPHVGLWGVGWLPRRWAAGYVRRRRRCEWTVQPLSPEEARRLAEAAGWDRIRVEPPEVPREWASGLSPGHRLAVRGYAAARSLRPTRGLLRRFGPMWQLTASREDRGCMGGNDEG
jgi:SAM-dependent methyltransferase